MTLGVIFNQKSNKASEPDEEYFHFHGYFLFDLNWCQAGRCSCLPTVADWVRVPFGTLGQVLNDLVTMLQTHTSWTMWFFLRLLELVGSVVRFQS